MQTVWIDSIDGIRLQGAIHRTQLPKSMGTVVQAHGITADMDEGGMFARLASSLSAVGFDVLRFTFRGHGKSGGTQKGVTIAGEMLDLQAAIDESSRQFGGPLSIVAASFGAVSACLSLPFLDDRLRALALWNPVLDLEKTFISPELPWAKASFNKAGMQNLITEGHLLLDGTFAVGRVLYEEMKNFYPYPYFVRSAIPAMIVHGDRDSAVSYEISRAAAQEHRNCQLFTIGDSDHGFDGRDHEDKAIDITVQWLRSQLKR
jgi:alpha/beta superfamily hydrolase